MHFPIHPMLIVIPVCVSGGNYFLGQVCSTARGLTKTEHVPPIPAETLSVVGTWLHGLQLFSKNTGFWSSTQCAWTWGVNQVSGAYVGTIYYCDTTVSNRNVFTKHPLGLTSDSEQSELSPAVERQLCSWVCANTGYPRRVRSLAGRIPQIEL